MTPKYYEYALPIAATEITAAETKPIYIPKAVLDQLPNWGSTYPYKSLFEMGKPATGPDGCLCGKCLRWVMEAPLHQVAEYLVGAWGQIASKYGPHRATADITSLTRGFNVMVNFMVNAEYYTMTLSDRRTGQECVVALTSGASINERKVKRMQARIPGLEAPVECPGCADRHVIRTLIIHLNDAHKWKREKIADHLETLQAQGIDLTVHQPKEQS